MGNTSAIASTTATFAAQNKQSSQTTAAAGFDAALTIATSNAETTDFVTKLIDNIMNSMSAKHSKATSDATTSDTQFSSSFTSIFGTDGPLPDFISAVTKTMHLTPAQSKALQEIAVNNKDITNTPANVQKIAAELKQAGIG